MKILNGVSSVSIQSTRYLTDELNKMGHNAEIMIYEGQELLKGFEDINLNIDRDNYLYYPKYAYKILKYFIKSLKKYDVFHFHFGHSMLPYNVDLRILKKMNKKVYMEYHGSDIRRESVFVSNNPFNNKAKLGIDDNKSYRLQKRIAKNVDGIIVHDFELKEHLFDFDVAVHNLPLRINLAKFEPYFPQKKPVLSIVHAPSRRATKGTQFIIEAVNKLKLEHNIEFTLIEGLSNSNAKKLYEKADIVIDQLVIGTYGMLSIESMALGKPTICYIREDLLNKFQEVPPLYNANIYNIFEKLEKLIEDFELRAYLGKMGRKYVEKHHNAILLAEKAIEIYQL